MSYRLRVYAPIDGSYDAIRIFRGNTILVPLVTPAGSNTYCYDEYVYGEDRSVGVTFLTDDDFYAFANVFSRWVINVDGVVSYQTPTVDEEYRCVLPWLSYANASDVQVRLELGEPITPASLSVSVSATGSSKAQLSGVFSGGSEDYNYQRYLRVTIDGYGTFDVYSKEYSGGYNTFSQEITGLSANTVYKWSATLYTRTIGGWTASSYTASGAFVTSNVVGNAYIYTDQWRRYTPYIYTDRWRPYTAKIYTDRWR